MSVLRGQRPSEMLRTCRINPKTTQAARRSFKKAATKNVRQTKTLIIQANVVVFAFAVHAEVEGRASLGFLITLPQYFLLLYFVEKNIFEI